LRAGDRAKRLICARHASSITTEQSQVIRHPVQIEVFEPIEDTRPTKPYQARLKWRDLAGDEQSKLLVTAPKTVIAEIILNAKVESRVRDAAGIKSRLLKDAGLLQTFRKFLRRLGHRFGV
jgi:hypothetical protein